MFRVQYCQNRLLCSTDDALQTVPLWLWSRQQHPPGADGNLPGKDDRRRHQGPGIYVHIPPTNVWLRNKTGCTGFGYDQEMCIPRIFIGVFLLKFRCRLDFMAVCSSENGNK